jgi:hypothetical protein
MSVLSRSSFAPRSVFLGLSPSESVLFGQKTVVSLNCHHESIVHLGEHFWSGKKGQLFDL